MKSINKLIAYYVCEIIVVICLVGVSIPLWQKFDNSQTAKVAQMYDTMDYLYLNVDKYIETEKIEDNIAIVNDTNTQRNYVLLLKLDKNIDYTNLNVNLNEEQVYLSDIIYNKDDSYNYFNIGSGNLVANQVKYNLTFLDDSIDYKTINYEIIESEDI